MINLVIGCLNMVLSFIPAIPMPIRIANLVFGILNLAIYAVPFIKQALICIT